MNRVILRDCGSWEGKPSAVSDLMGVYHFKGASMRRLKELRPVSSRAGGDVVEILSLASGG